MFISVFGVRIGFPYNLTKNKTTLVIAHRLSTIHNADNIFVMKDGNIINAGSHDFLIDNCKEYKSLYQNN